MIALLIEIGVNLRLLGILAIVAGLIMQWWAFRLKGRR